MNILNQFFKKIYVISSYPTQNRLNDLIPFLNKENIECELVISPKKKYFDDENNEGRWLGKGNFSLISANESVFLKESYLKSESFCILEDDVFFDINYKEKLNLFFKDVPNDWEILNLGYHAHTSISFNDNLSYYKLKRDEQIVGTHFLAYKNNVINYTLEKIESEIYPIDWFLSKTIYPNFNTYTCMDKIFYASSYRECELDKSEFYKKYISRIDGK